MALVANDSFMQSHHPPPSGIVSAPPLALAIHPFHTPPESLYEDTDSDSESSSQLSSAVLSIRTNMRALRKKMMTEEIANVTITELVDGTELVGTLFEQLKQSPDYQQVMTVTTFTPINATLSINANISTISSTSPTKSSHSGDNISTDDSHFPEQSTPIGVRIIRLKDDYEQLKRWVTEVRTWFKDAQRFKIWIDERLQQVKLSPSFEPLKKGPLEITLSQHANWTREIEILSDQLREADEKTMKALKQHVKEATAQTNKLNPGETATVSITLSVVKAWSNLWAYVNDRAFNLRVLELRLQWQTAFNECDKRLLQINKEINNFSNSMTNLLHQDDVPTYDNIDVLENQVNAFELKIEPLAETEVSHAAAILDDIITLIKVPDHLLESQEALEESVDQATSQVLLIKEEISQVRLRRKIWEEEQENRRLEEEEKRRLKEEEEKQLKEEEEKRRLKEEEEKRRLKAEEEKRRLKAEEEKRRLKAEEEKRRLKEEEEKRRLKEEEEKRLKEEEERRLKEEEEKRLKEEEERRLKEEMRRLKEEEEKRLKEEEEKRLKEEEMRRLEEEEEKRLKDEEEKRLKEEEEKRLKEEEEKRLKEKEEKRLKEEEERRLKEEKRQLEEEEKIRLREEEKRVEEERRQQELERKRAEEDARRQAEEEKQRVEFLEKTRLQEEMRIHAQDQEKKRLQEEAKAEKRLFRQRVDEVPLFRDVNGKDVSNQSEIENNMIRTNPARHSTIAFPSTLSQVDSQEFIPKDRKKRLSLSILEEMLRKSSKSPETPYKAERLEEQESLRSKAIVRKILDAQNSQQKRLNVEEDDRRKAKEEEDLRAEAEWARLEAIALQKEQLEQELRRKKIESLVIVENIKQEDESDNRLKMVCDREVRRIEVASPEISSVELPTGKVAKVELSTGEVERVEMPIAKTDDNQTLSSTSVLPLNRQLFQNSLNTRSLSSLSMATTSIGSKSGQSLNTTPKFIYGKKTPKRRILRSTAGPTSSVDSLLKVTTPRPNRYRARSNDHLDLQVERIVNEQRFAVEIRAGDRTGQYYIGRHDPKLYFCRILASQTVMVRIGGGWQELGSFLQDRYGVLSPITTPEKKPLDRYEKRECQHDYGLGILYTRRRVVSAIDGKYEIPEGLIPDFRKARWR